MITRMPSPYVVVAQVQHERNIEPVLELCRRRLARDLEDLDQVPCGEFHEEVIQDKLSGGYIVTVESDVEPRQEES